MRVNLKIVQVLADLLIPVLGYFFWGWGLFFIILYYVLDLLVSEVFMHLKTRAIRLHQGGTMLQSMSHIGLSLAFIVTILLLVRIFMFQIHPEMKLTEEIIAFWSYKDMGIAQGYVLIPLVALVGFQRYKTEFIQKQIHESLTISALWKTHYKNLLLLLTSVGLMTGISFFIPLPDLLCLGLLLGGTSTYQLVR